VRLSAIQKDFTHGNKNILFISMQKMIAADMQQMQSDNQ